MHVCPFVNSTFGASCKVINGWCSCTVPAQVGRVWSLRHLRAPAGTAGLILTLVLV